MLWREARVDPAGVVLEAGANPWGLRFQRMMDMANDSGLFHDTPAPDRLPLYEARLIHQFDHRWATYDDGDSRDATPDEKADPGFTVTPHYWVDSREVLARVARVLRGLAAGEVARGFALDDGELAAVGRIDGEEAALALVEDWITAWSPGWLMGWRDICRSTDERTVIASVVPRVAVGHTAPLMFPSASALHCAALLGNLNALVLDYVARQKVGGTHLTYGFLKQFAVLPPDHYSDADFDFILPRVLELTYTAHDLAPWARDLGHAGPSFPWDPDRRALLRAGAAAPTEQCSLYQ